MAKYLSIYNTNAISCSVILTCPQTLKGPTVFEIKYKYSYTITKNSNTRALLTNYVLRCRYSMNKLV